MHYGSTSPKRMGLVMHMRIFLSRLSHVCLLLVLTWLSGCAGLTQYAPSKSVKLTSVEESRVGTAVEGLLLQMLGGPYNDRALSEDLNHFLPGTPPFKISIADRSAPALYPLPGGRAIMTRGLLAHVRNRVELELLVAHAVYLSEHIYDNPVRLTVAEATTEILTASPSEFAPDSAAIRLARLFEKYPCEQDCLSQVLLGGSKTVHTGQVELPESVKRLSGLHSGYELLAKAQELEKQDDKSNAIATYLQAAAKTPDEPRILGSLGLAYLRVGQLQQARLHLQRAAGLQPEYYRVQMGLGYLYLQLSRYSQANQALANSVLMLPVTENLFLLAEAREKSGDVAGAMSLYRLVAETDRTSKLGQSAASRLAQSAGVR